MTYQKPYSTERGIILIDVLLALSLSVVFIAGIAGISMQSRDLFERAKERSLLLDAYEASGPSYSGLQIGARPYGNERTEEEISTSSLIFTRVHSDPLKHMSDAAGTPLCSVDFNDQDVAGSYPAHSAASGSLSLEITPIALPIDPLLPLTDIQVRDGTAYISADSSTASDPDLAILDIRDPAHPALLSSISTGPGIAAISLAGNRVFAAASSAAAELHVIRLDSLAAPVMESKYRLPLPEASTAPPFGSSIFYDRGLVYLGTEKWDGDEFSIINADDPASPAKVGGFETGSRVNAIYVRGAIAYVAASDQYQLRAIDVSSAASPVLVGSFSPSGWSRQEGNAVDSFENSLQFGRTSGGYDIPTDHEAFDWATSSFLIGPPPEAQPLSRNIPGGVYGIVADRSHIFLATRTPGHELTVFDSAFSASTSYALPAPPQAMTCDGDRLYILAHAAPVIYEISFR